MNKDLKISIGITIVAYLICMMLSFGSCFLTKTTKYNKETVTMEKENTVKFNDYEWKGQEAPDILNVDNGTEEVLIGPRWKDGSF